MRLITKQCFDRAAYTEGYNFATEQSIAASIVPIDVQLNVHSNSTNKSICANCAISSEDLHLQLHLAKCSG